jgi:lysophospholipase L1-like esterase
MRRIYSTGTKSLAAAMILACAFASRAEQPASFRLAGDWQVEVVVKRTSTGVDTQPQTVAAAVSVSPAERVKVVGEEYPALPVFNANAAGWMKGVPLRGLMAYECTTPNLLEPESVQVRAGPAKDAPQFQRGTDYDLDSAWGTIGRLPGGRIAENQPVYIDYVHGLLRIDAVVLTADGRIAVRRGQPRSAAPLPPVPLAGERLLGNIWLPGRLSKLRPESLFPVLETAYPEPPKAHPSPAENLLPRTMAKLRQGDRLRILAWGDSVTDGSYLPARDRWQAQFVARLAQRFPKARVELLTEAWGGRNTASYLAEPPGSGHNYAEKLLETRPDLIVSEFVNDAGLNPERVEQRYARFLADFKNIGAEWIILTPHYVRPDWMGLDREREVDDDPRPYVAGLRQFAARHGVALADASRRYGRLWRQGLPYSSLMVNSINHPDARGMALFADSLTALFP